MSHLFREPYRVFFPLGCLAAFLGVGYWVAFSLHWISDYSPLFHSSVQTQIFAHCFILGFLMTALPRFTGSVTAQPGEVIHMAICVCGQAVLLVLNHMLAAQILFGWTLCALLIFIFQRVQSRRTGASPPSEFIWLPFVILTALTGVILTLLASWHGLPIAYTAAGKKMVEQGWVFGIVCGVGGFLAPRLMGTFRAPNLSNLEGQKNKVRLFYAVLASLFYASFWTEVFSPRWGALLRATVVTLNLFYSLNGFAWPKVPDFYAKMIWFSFLNITLGLWLAALMPSLSGAAIHIMMIGGVGLMIFAVASMVILTHQGKPEMLKRPLPILILLAAATALGLALRLWAFVDTVHYFMWAGFAGALWAGAVMIWLVWMLPRVLMQADSSAVERQHEQAKQRIAAARQQSGKSTR